MPRPMQGAQLPRRRGPLPEPLPAPLRRRVRAGGVALPPARGGRRPEGGQARSSPATRRSCTRGRATRCSSRWSARTRCWSSTRRSTCARARCMLPPFHGERMRVYGDVMRELTEAEVERWPVGEPFPLLPSMQRLTLRIILRTVFGLEEGARMAELEERDRPHAAARDADHARAAAAARRRAAQPGRAVRRRARRGRPHAAGRDRAPARARRRGRRRPLDADGRRTRTPRTRRCATTS